MGRRKLLLSTVNNQLIPNNQIWYTTTDESRTYIEESLTEDYPLLISNIYENGIGIMTFDRELTRIPYSIFRRNLDITSIILPNSVITIETGAFSGATNLKSIKIQEGVTTIESSAFSKCTSLESLHLPESLQYIGINAFGESSLKSIYIPSNVTELGESAFMQCVFLEKVTLSKNITSIKSRTFEKCYGLSSITLPSNISEIGDKAFFDCQALRRIFLPDTLNTIGEGVFGNCYKLTEFNGKFASEDGKYLIIPNGEDNKLIAYAMDYFPEDKTYRIPEGVTTIGAYSFYDLWYNIQHIVLPASTVNIEDNAFYSEYEYNSSTTLTINSNVTASNISFNSFPFDKIIFGDNVTNIVEELCLDNDKIKEVTIGKNILSIENRAFKNINDDASIIFQGNTPPVLGEEVFDEIANLTIEVPKAGLSNYITSNWSKEYILKIKGLSDAPKECIITYNGKLQDIYPVGEDGVLSHQKGKIVFDHIVTEIPDNKFKNQTGLKSITLPPSLERIGNNAFESCTSLVGTFTTLPSSLKTIGESAFIACINLANINIPNSVQSIGNYAFNNAYNLTVKCFCQSPPSIGDSTFDINHATIWVLKAKYDVYSNSSVWEDHKEHFIIMDSNGKRVQSNSEIWYTTTNNAKLTLPENNYKSHSFENGTGIITFENTLTEIPSNQFYECTTLCNVSIPDSVTTIGDWAFMGCSNLIFTKGSSSDVTIDREIPSTRVVGLPDFKPGGGGIPSTSKQEINVELPTSITTIGKYAFYRCTSIKDINLPNLITIKAFAIAGCQNLQNIIVSDDIAGIGIYAFSGCVNLKSISLGKLITQISNNVFDGCESLNSIDLSNIVHIASNAFRDCKSISNINLYNVEYINSNAFYGTNIKNVYIEDLQKWCNIDFGNYYSNPMHSKANFYVGNKLLNNTTVEITGKVRPFSFVNMTFATVRINNNVEIQSNAFNKCTILNSIEISYPYNLVYNSFSETTATFSRININDDSFKDYVEGNMSANLPGEKIIRHRQIIEGGYLLLPDDIKNIGAFAFYNSNLTKIDLSKNVERIGSYAFGNCDLEEIYCRREEPPIVGNQIFGDPDKLEAGSILVPNNTYLNIDDEDTDRSGWKEYPKELFGLL